MTPRNLDMLPTTYDHDSDEPVAERATRNTIVMFIALLVNHALIARCRRSTAMKCSSASSWPIVACPMAISASRSSSGTFRQPVMRVWSQ